VRSRAPQRLRRRPAPEPDPDETEYDHAIERIGRTVEAVSALLQRIGAVLDDGCANCAAQSGVGALRDCV
jgi:hypothetical protein